jgi:hypothetical protein
MDTSSCSPAGGVMVQAIKLESKGIEKSMVCRDIDNHHSLLNFFNGASIMLLEAADFSL